MMAYLNQQRDTLKNKLPKMSKPILREILSRLSKEFHIADNVYQVPGDEVGNINLFTTLLYNMDVHDGEVLGKRIKESTDADKATSALWEAKLQAYMNDGTLPSVTDLAELNRWLTGFGEYRKKPVIITDQRYYFPRAVEVPNLMRKLQHWVQTELSTSTLDANSFKSITSAIEAHIWLAAIHPFEDGNGRVARLLMNLLLMREGHLPVLISKRKGSKYRYKVSMCRSALYNSCDFHRTMLFESLRRTYAIVFEVLAQAKL